MLNGFSYHADSKTKADEELNREIGVINEEEVCTDKENIDQNGNCRGRGNQQGRK